MAMVTGKNCKVYSAGAISAIGGFLFGYEIAVISGILTMDDFKSTMNIANTNSSNEDGKRGFDPKNAVIVGILLFGCFVGSLIGGQTSDRFSRKYSISFFSFVFTIGAVIQMTSCSLYQLLTGRFIAGIAVGALSMIVPVYHSEIAATNIRGRVITLQQWAITLGIAISFWVNVVTSSGSSELKSYVWRIPLGLQIVPSLILTISILFCPFSPRWLISHDREDEARNVLQKIRATTYDTIEEEMTRIKNEVAYLRENEIDSYRQLFRPPLLRPVLLGIVIQILQQMTGMNSIIYYAPIIFSRTLNGSHSAFSNPALLATGVNGCVNFIATIPTIIFIDKLGRRTLLITGALIMSISMLILAILSKKFDDNPSSHSISVALLVLIYVFVAAYAYSWGPVPWVYCAEIFPLTMRAKATSLTTAANWATNCLMSFIALELLGARYFPAFITFCICCTLMIGIVYIFYPETKQRHLEQRNLDESSQIFTPQWTEIWKHLQHSS